MASTEIVILSSSPPKQSRSFEMFSSPGFPSPSQLFQKKAPVLRTGSRAMPIPQDATARFTTASRFFKNASNDETAVDTIRPFKTDSADGNLPIPEAAKLSQRKARESAIRERGAKPSCKTDPKKDDRIDPAPTEKKPRKPRAKKLDVLDEDGNAVQKPPPKPRAKKVAEYDENGNVKEKTPQKPVVKKTAVEYDEEGNIKQKAARKPRAKQAKGEPDKDTIREKTVRKPRAKKMDGETQTKMPKRQVLKPSTSSRLEKAEDISGPVESWSAIEHLPIGNDPFEDPLDHHLAPAAKRRIDWTPPRPTSSLDLSTPVDNSPSKGEERNIGFTNLFGSFGFNSAQGTSKVEKKLLDVAVTKKRKLIELLKTNPGSETASSLKEKVVKKKARTLTDLATSAYAPEEELVETPAPILQYFAYQNTERLPNDGFKVPPKPRSRSPRKKVGKGTVQAPILLSPESALKQVGAQNFVFGTSSQLAREESPTFLRDIHAAMQASNVLDDPFADSYHESAAASIAGGRAIAPMKRNLWCAASRDAVGGLTDVDMIDMVDSPVISNTSELPLREEQQPPITQVRVEVRHNIDESTEPLPISQCPRKSIGPIEAAIRDELSSSPAVTPKKADASKASKASKSQQSGTPVKKLQATKVPILGRPDFAAYTTAQLTKAIASYRFKPIKSRDQMVIMLERCWESKQRLALGTLPTNTLVSSSQSKDLVATTGRAAPSSQVAGMSPKRPRGRPRKDSTTTSPKMKSKPKVTHTIENLELDSDTPLSRIRTLKKPKDKAAQLKEDISDSDTYQTPSPPRRRPSEIRTTPLALQSSTVEESIELSPKSSQTRLFKYINRAVTNASPAKDPYNPSWHEKILLFDPIVLEDLTVWLNTGGLEQVGWDGEVEPKEVKKWCESKSICCLWKENLRGGARSRY